MISIAACLKGEVATQSKVTLSGWVKTRRDSKSSLSFIHLQDGSCFNPIQIIATDALSNYHTEVTKLTAGCALTVEGTLVPSLGKGQDFEIHADNIQVVGWVQNPDTYPIQAKRHTLEYLREVAHLRVRTNTIAAVSRVRHTLALAIHDFLDRQGFYWIHTPLITSSDCEGAGEMFRVSTLDLANVPRTPDGKIDFTQDFFGRETFLTVSGQLNVEAYALALSKVYTFGPTFRAENSNTSRHLAEFWMLEPEMAFAGLEDIAQLSESLLKHLIHAVLEKRADDMAFFDQHIAPGCIEKLQLLSNHEFARLEYTEAINILQSAKQSFEYPVHWGIDLQSEHERYLAEVYCKKPVIVTNYPKDIKSFYMRLNDDGKTVANMDVLAPGIGEIIGGSAREDRLELLESRMLASGMDANVYQWYLDLRRYGSAPHAGFGLGFERLISYITGLSNIRDVIPFPRTPGNCNY
ncbi:MAG: asparagine--tRNA ligase [Legionellaceae bacterium]|nr:asparagine--tRNA ligase [Legionellaceae bacterium]